MWNISESLKNNEDAEKISAISANQRAERRFSDSETTQLNREIELIGYAL